MTLSALRWHPCLHCAGSITSIVLSSSLALRRRHCLHCIGIFALVVLELSPTSHLHCRKHCKLATALSQCNRDTSAYVALSLCSLSTSVAVVAVTGTVSWQLGLDVQQILHWWFCQRCAGVLARVALASLQALRCCLCQHCTGVVTNVALASLPSLCWHCPQHCKLASAQPRHSRNTSVCVALLSWSSSLPMASLQYLALFHGDLASDGPADAALVSLPALCWRPWPYCAGVITNIALLLLPALHWHHCPCCVGAFALVALALLPSLPLLTASIANWRLPSHEAVPTRAGILASIAPLLLPALRQHCCLCCTGVFAPVALATPPSAHPRYCQHHELASAQS